MRDLYFSENDKIKAEEYYEKTKKICENRHKSDKISSREDKKENS